MRAVKDSRFLVLPAAFQHHAEDREMHDIWNTDDDTSAGLQNCGKIFHRLPRFSQMLNNIAQDDVVKLLMPRRSIQLLHIERLNDGKVACHLRRFFIKFNAIDFRLRIRIANSKERCPAGTTNFKHIESIFLEVHMLQEFRARYERIRITQAILLCKSRIILCIIEQFKSIFMGKRPARCNARPICLPKTQAEIKHEERSRAKLLREASHVQQSLALRQEAEIQGN